MKSSSISLDSTLGYEQKLQQISSENQEDSGHPSMETLNNSPKYSNSKTSTPHHDQANVEKDGAQKSIVQKENTEDTTTKSNPFLAGTNLRSNKIILQPIELPLRLNTKETTMEDNDSQQGHSAINVPKHLFSAKSK